MVSFLDCCRFLPTAGGTTDWTYASAVGGYQSPAAAGAVNGATYRYRAESADLAQWEIGYGGYNSSTAVLSRSAVLFNSTGTTSKINFSTVPQVAIVALAEDLNGFALHTRTRTVYTSGSGSYMAPAGCTAINVRLVGGGGGGGASAAGATAGGTGGQTVFSGLVANGGSGGAAPGSAANSGGTAAGGDFNIQGASSGPTAGAGAASAIYQGCNGAPGPFGGSGAGGYPGAPGGAATSNSGGGGGGVGTSSAGLGGGGGNAGGYLEKLITSPAGFYGYTVGAGGVGGSNGAGQPGGIGGSGLIIIDEYY
jgi:hypothetical protein